MDVVWYPRGDDGADLHGRSCGGGEWGWGVGVVVWSMGVEMLVVMWWCGGVGGWNLVGP